MLNAQQDYRYIDSKAEYASSLFAREFKRLVSETHDGGSETVILCIGTDRATGDSLGPITGSKLLGGEELPAYLYGTLEEPVHASNLAHTISVINKRFSRPYIIAIDAALGKAELIGFLKLGRGPLAPGLSLNKKLPQVGSIHITGVVNAGGVMELLTLQTTKLSVVMKMADVISEGIKKSF